jgi:hypothetical protein
MTKARDNANGGFGLVLVKPSSVVGGTDNGKGTVSFSAATTLSLNGIFTSTYDSYRMVFTSLTASANVLLRLRWRKSGSDNSGATYYSGVHFTNWSGTAGVSTSSAGATSAAIIYLATGGGTLSLDINTPLSRPTVTGLGMATGPEDRGIYLSSYMNVTDTYDGVTFFPASGNITGALSVYGYNK